MDCDVCDVFQSQVLFFVLPLAWALDVDVNRHECPPTHPLPPAPFPSQGP